MNLNGDSKLIEEKLDQVLASVICSIYLLQLFVVYLVYMLLLSFSYQWQVSISLISYFCKLNCILKVSLHDTFHLFPTNVVCSKKCSSHSPNFKNFSFKNMQFLYGQKVVTHFKLRVTEHK
jgi:hypothetical protein